MIFAYQPHSQSGTLSDEASWPKQQGDTEESHFKSEYEEVSDCCSREMFNPVKRMLRHNPGLRPSLNELRESIYVELSKLDLQHGTEIKCKRKREVAEDLRIYPSVDSDGSAKSDLGDVYSPPRKRLKIDLTDATRDQYAQLVTAWNDSDLNADDADLNEIVDAVDRYLLEDGDPQDQAAKHFISCLRKRIDQDTADCYVLWGNEIKKDSINKAMSVAGKFEVLASINDIVFWDEDAYNSTREARETLRQVLDWGTMLL